MMAWAGHWSTRCLSILLAGLMVIGCGTSSQFVPGAGKKYVYSYTMVAPVPDRQLVFEDDRIAVNFTIDEAAILFRLQNKTDRAVRILWERVVMGIGGRFDRVRHATDLYADSLDTRPFPLPARGFVRDLLLPYLSIRHDGQRWVEKPLYRTVDEHDDSLRTLIVGNIGKRLRVVLPLEIAGAITEYDFEFEVTGVDEISWREWAPLPREPRPPATPKGLSKQEQTVTIAIIVGFLAMFALLVSADKKPPSE